MNKEWQVYCLRLAMRKISASRLIAGEPGELQIPYVMWCLRSGSDVVVVDTGLSEYEGKKRELEGMAAPSTALGWVDVDSTKVMSVVGTHLHGDHFSAWDAFPAARFTLQLADLAFFTGPHAKYSSLNRSAPDMPEVMRLNSAGRLDIIDGEAELAPGVTLVPAGGHTPGTQVVRVNTAKGEIVLCSDSVDLYRSLELWEPAPISTSRADSVVAFDRILGMVDGDLDRLFPGHEPLMLEKGEQLAPNVFKMA